MVQQLSSRFERPALREAVRGKSTTQPAETQSEPLPLQPEERDTQVLKSLTPTRPANRSTYISLLTPLKSLLKLMKSVKEATVLNCPKFFCTHSESLVTLSTHDSPEMSEKHVTYHTDSHAQTHVVSFPNCIIVSCNPHSILKQTLTHLSAYLHF